MHEVSEAAPTYGVAVGAAYTLSIGGVARVAPLGRRGPLAVAVFDFPMTFETVTAAGVAHLVPNAFAPLVAARQLIAVPDPDTRSVLVFDLSPLALRTPGRLIALALDTDAVEQIAIEITTGVGALDVAGKRFAIPALEIEIEVEVEIEIEVEVEVEVV